MAHSTTATASHTLLKYSRSYPGQRPSTGPSGIEAEWQHFANPIIRLVLDTRKSARGDLESVRLRILWSMNAGLDSADAGQDEVTFEDLDLLTFSSLQGSMLSQPSHAQSLPLKAVYREAMVGIRYLHPRVVTAGTTPVYRRFQITFASVTAASGFINAIRNVCPCKANTAPVPNRSMTMNAPAIHSDHPMQAPTASTPARHKSVAGTSLASSTQFARSQVHRSSPLGSETMGNATPASGPPCSYAEANRTHGDTVSHNLRLSDRQNRPSAMSLAAITTGLSGPHGAADMARSSDAADLASTSAFVDASLPAVPSMPGVPQTGVVIRGESVSAATRTFTSNVNPLPSMMCPGFPPPPAPTPPSSNSDSSAMLPLPLPSSLPLAVDRPVSPAASSNTQTVGPTQLMTSLRELPELYSLSSADLQALVGHVIREEGFLQLLESLDRMWREKGFLNQS